MVSVAEVENVLNPDWVLDETPVSMVSETLMSRENSYGDFAAGSRIAQHIKCVFYGTENWEDLSDDKKSSLEMIAFKISRILNGDPSNHDSWHDIAGYAQLIANTLDP